MLLRYGVQPETALLFVNSIELVILLAVAALFINLVRGQLKSFGDVWRRLRRVLVEDYQGGPYDIMIAVSTLVVGEAMRRAVVWEWRMFGHAMSLEILVVATLLVATGGLCLVRILVPCKRYNVVWISIGVAALVFAIASVLLK